MAMTREALQAHMDAAPFIAWTGMQVADADPEHETLVVTMAFQPGFERSAGTNQVHGGPIAALIDTAGCYAIVMMVEKAVPTINFRTDYLRPAIDTSLRAVAKVRRAGRTVGVVDVDVFDDADRLIAVGRGAFGTFAA